MTDTKHQTPPIEAKRRNIKVHESTDRAIQLYKRRSLDARNCTNPTLIDLIVRRALAGTGLPFPAEFSEEDTRVITFGE